MTNNKKIVWLASYPKSGDTWFRVFLLNLISGSDKPVDINELNEITIASNRQLFDDMTGLSSADMTLSEIERLRPYVYESLAGKSGNIIFMKIHDAFIFTSENKPLVSEKATLKALYFIRNPLDIAVSFAHHLDVSFEESVEIICNNFYAFCNRTDRLHNQLEQRLFSWSGHVKSWTEQSIVPVKIIRYEDMLNDTFNIFSEAVQFLELDFSNDSIQKALKNSSFNEMQKQESEKGFNEKAPGTELFFRKGRSGTWREELSGKLIDKIIANHSEVMKLYNYLDDNGNPK